MSIKAFEAIVEKGQIKLPANIKLPEKAKVYVLVPDEEVVKVAHIYSPRLAKPEQAVDFIKEVIENQ